MKEDEYCMRGKYRIVDNVVNCRIVRNQSLI